MPILKAVFAGVLLLIPAGVWAQQSKHGQAAQPEMDLAVTYTAQRASTVAKNTFWPQGGSAELTATFFHGLGMAADVTGTHINQMQGSGASNSTGLTLVTTTFGPTYTWALPGKARSARQWRIFGESLIGIANGLNSTFPGVNGATTDANSLALQVGGGVDLNLTHHFALQLLHADWLRTQLPNGATNVQNTLELGAGIVLRLR